MTHYTHKILDEIRLNIFIDTGMASSPEEATFLWQWAVQHKRAGVSDTEAVWWFWQMIAAKNPDNGAGYLKIKPSIIREKCKALYPDTIGYMSRITEAQFRQVVMG